MSISVQTNYPRNQIIYGGSATYALSGPPAGWQVSGAVQWWYQQTDCLGGVSSDWYEDDTAGLSLSTIEGTPGAFTIQAVVPLKQVMNQQNPNPKSMTVIATLGITVPPPDKITLPKGPFTANWIPIKAGPTTVGFKTDVVTLGFPVTCQGITPNSLPNATLLEDVKNAIAFGKFQPRKRDVKITLGGITGISLMDEKFIIIGQDRPQLFQGFFNGSYPAGYVFYRYDQTLKLQIPDYNDNPRIYPLGPTFTFKQTSTNGNDSPTTITLQ